MLDLPSLTRDLRFWEQNPEEVHDKILVLLILHNLNIMQGWYMYLVPNYYAITEIR